MIIMGRKLSRKLFKNIIKIMERGRGRWKWRIFSMRRFSWTRLSKKI